MSSKEINSKIILSKLNIPKSRIYFDKRFPLYKFQWEDIYSKVTINTYLRLFQYKIVNNILYPNEILHTFGSSNTQLCSFCKMEGETIYKISGIKFRLISSIVCIFHN